MAVDRCQPVTPVPILARDDALLQPLTTPIHLLIRLRRKFRSSPQRPISCLMSKRTSP